MHTQCPCKSGKTYSLCCLPIIEGSCNAQTAEALMRSRYTAYTQANGNYLMKSHHVSTRPLNEKKHIEKWAASVTWLGLHILKTEKKTDTEEIVEFKAIFREKGLLSFIHEASTFTKEKGTWFYVSGKHL